MATYQKLRECIRANGMTMEDMAEELEICPAALSLKLNGHRPFKLAEMWKIMDIIGMPDYQFHEIFPRQD